MSFSIPRQTDTSGDYYPAAHSLIVGDALRDLIHADFGVRPTGDVLLIQSGLNDHYSLPTEEGKRIVRVYRAGWRSDGEVEWELELLNHLRERDAPVAAGIRRTEGSWYSSIAAIEGVRQVALFERAPGVYTHFGSPGSSRISPADHAEQFGRSMAQIHVAADSFHSTLPRFTLDLTYLIDQPLQAIARVYARRGADVQGWERMVERYKDLLHRGQLSSLDWGPIHGDMTGGNSTYSDSQVIHFDFDLAGPGWRAYDLAVFYWSMTINGHVADVWWRFLQGYSSARPLPRRDLSLVGAFAGVRELWLTGLWCAMAPVLGTHTLHEAFFDRSMRRLVDFYESAALAGEPR